MILLSHATGNQNSRHAAHAFAAIGQLAGFSTALALPKQLGQWLPSKFAAEVARRDFSGIGGNCISAAPLRETIRLLSTRLGLLALSKSEESIASIDRVYGAVDRATAQLLTRLPKVNAVFAYEDGAYHTFKAAKALGIRCIYELPIGYWREHRRLNEAEAIRRPEWSTTWLAAQDSAEKCARKDAELAMADLIVVASSYTRETLARFPGDLAPVIPIPYGFPGAIAPEDRTWHAPGTPLKLLYVGGLSQRKGLAEICEAVTSIGNRAEITLIGAGPAEGLLRQRLPEARFLGSLPHDQVLEQMRCHDVLLFPSLFEGFGLVIGEAMSQGMVVIASDRTAVRDISDADSAFCVPAESGMALAKIITALHESPELCARMGRAALQNALVWSWENYEVALRENIFSLLP